MTAEERMRERAAQVADEDGGVPPESWRVIGDLIRALPLEGEDQRGAQQVGTDTPKATEDSQSAPHHSRPEQVSSVSQIPEQSGARPAPAREPYKCGECGKAEACSDPLCAWCGPARELSAVEQHLQHIERVVVAYGMTAQHAESLGNIRMELDRLRATNRGLNALGMIRINELLAEIAALREDAERYRWLRECTGPVAAGVDQGDGVPTGVQWLDTTDLDTAIDAAIEKERIRG